MTETEKKDVLAALEALRGSIDQKDAISKDVVEKTNKRLDELEAKNQTATLAIEAEKVKRLEAEEKLKLFEAEIKMMPAGKGKDDKNAEHKAFCKFLAKGKEALSSEETKLLSVGVGADGGVLCPEEYKAELDKDITEMSPMRSIARVLPCNSFKVRMPYRKTRSTVAPTPEAEEINASSSTYDLRDFTLHKVSGLSKATVELLSGAAEFNVEQLINEDLAEDFAYKEGFFFVKGTGDAGNQPKGFTNDSDVPTYALPANFNADDLIKMEGELKVGYDPIWTLNRKSLAYIRTLKDSSGRYVFQPFLSEKAPSTVLGRNYVLMPDMDNERSVGKVPISLGDYRKGYLILDYSAASLLRDPYSEGSKGIIKIIAHRFLAGGVLRSEAIINGKITA